MLIPSTTSELIKCLDTLHPVKCIGEKQSEIAAHRYAGKRELIDWLIIKQAQAEEDGLTSVMESNN